jgi:hypothetical protein
MLLNEIIDARQFNNWSLPDEQTIRADFSEYKKKEQSKWEGRARSMGFRFPIFDTIEDFKQALDNAPVIALTHDHDNQINNRSHCDDLSCLKDLVGSYVRPRDVDRIVQGYESNAKIPMPIVLKGSKGEWIMAGNTRLDAAFILNVQPKVILIDVSA